MSTPILMLTNRKTFLIDEADHPSTTTSSEEDHYAREDPKMAEFLNDFNSDGDSDAEANRLMCMRKNQQKERGQP